MRMARGSPSRDCWRAVCMKSYRRRMLAIYLGLMLRCTRSRQHPHSSIAANSSQALYAKCTRRNSQKRRSLFSRRCGPYAWQPPVEKRHRFGSLRKWRLCLFFSRRTPDGLFHRVLPGSGPDPPRDPRVYFAAEKARAFARNRSARHLFMGLPPAWDPANRTLWPRPLLYHVFGRLDDPEDPAAFDITEEDHLEMLCRLHSESYQPEQLYRELKPAHILFIGLPLAQWHARFFLRILRAQRLAIREERCVESLVADGLTRLTSIPQPRFRNRTGGVS
jgi:hypothetical protein